MGFLNHSTNNIIVDAVLTDAGRQALSRNDGSFSFVKFALSDDEVDYDVIKQFGRTVGKEKIEKNTPVFEALTNQTLAQKYRSISVSNPNLVRLPSLSLTGENLTDNVLSLGARTTRTSTVTVSQALQNEDTVDVELRDQAFVITMNNDFLQVENTSPDDIDGKKTAKYILARSPTETAIGGSKVDLTLRVKSISDAQFTTYGTTSNKNVIRTIVRVAGIQSGAVKEFAVLINKNN